MKQEERKLYPIPVFMPLGSMDLATNDEEYKRLKRKQRISYQVMAALFLAAVIAELVYVFG